MRAALTQVLKAYGEQRQRFSKAVPKGHDFFFGLSAAISLRMQDPLFVGPMRRCLDNPEADVIVERIVTESLRDYLARESESADAITARLVYSAKAGAEFPPIDYWTVSAARAALTRPQDVAERIGTHVEFPRSYIVRMVRRNGGRIKVAGDIWELFPVVDSSESPSDVGSRDDLVAQTKRARDLPGFPDGGLAVGSNGRGSLMVFLKESDQEPESDFHEPLPNAGDTVYSWDAKTKALKLIAEDFSDICWAPMPGVGGAAQRG